MSAPKSIRIRKGPTTESYYASDLNSAFEVGDDELILNAKSFNKKWHQALSQTLSEWESAEDEVSYSNL